MAFDPINNNFAPGLILPSGPNRVRVEVGGINGKVVLTFERPITQLVLEPQSAAEIAQAMARAALDMAKGTGAKIHLAE